MNDKANHAEILAALNDLRAKVSGLCAELKLQREQTSARQIRAERRYSMLRELANAVGPISWATAEEVEAILDFRKTPPAAMERIVCKLQDDPETPTSVRQIWRVIKPGN